MHKTVLAMRYLTPLREGGSLPAIVEAEDGALYVLKFVGAGQGRKALIAELVAGEIARSLGLRVPEMVLVELDEALGLAEPDPEIRDLIRFSAGLNLGFRYLPQAFMYSSLLRNPPPADLASTIVWFDAFITNVDRTPRNPNILVWKNDLWLIDHGAALYFHHTWQDYQARSQTPFPMIKEHVLLPFALALSQTDATCKRRLTAAGLREIIKAIPEDWLEGEPGFASIEAHRRAYLDYLVRRLDASPLFVAEAEHARTQRV